MNRIILFAIVSFLLFPLSTKGQDVIVKKDGSTILSKVLEVNKSEIKYKKFSNRNGPTYTIEISEIMSINYENGEKDDFSNAIPGDNQQSAQGMIKKTADANNKKIIELHNVIQPNYEGQSPSEKLWTSCTAKFGVKSSSILSNEDVEMKFVRRIGYNGSNNKELCYFVNIRNKTDKVLYIDKANCFKVYHNGYSVCYFDASTQTYVNNGGSSGASVNIGSLAGAFGIGGAIGQIANGINVGGGKSSSVSTSYTPQRFIAIPPRGNRFLTEYIWIGKGDGRTCVERPEDFNLESDYLESIGVKKGIVNKYGIKVFNEKELPWQRDYYITYSTDPTFSSYGSLHAELYIQEIIGAFKFDDELLVIHEKGNWFLNENTIVCRVYLAK